MKILPMLILFFSFLVLDGALGPGSAHQPRMVTSETIVVDAPEISKAYYGMLTSHPHFYNIRSSVDFDLYVNVLVPDIEGQKRTVSADILKDGEPFAVLDAEKTKWTRFFEPFGQSAYWKGPEFKTRAEAGNYTIRVRSPQNNIKYSLAIGEIEDFRGKEGLNAILLIPDLKKNFFNESPAGFILSPLGWGYVLVMYGLAFAVGYVVLRILKKRVKDTVGRRKKTFSNTGRIISLAGGLGLLAWALATSWSPLLLFASGLAFFSGLIGWHPQPSK